MRGLADARIEEAILRRLEAGPADVLEALAAARAAAPEPLAGREGAIHALLLRLVREDRIVPAGSGALGGTRYARRGAEVPPDDAVPAPPPAVPARDARAALRAAGLVRDPADRGRVVADVLAHRTALRAEGRAGAFGGVKPLRVLLRRADRGRALIAVPETAWESGKRWVLHEGPSVLATIVGVGLLWLFVAEFRVVPTNSMQPTLKPGDRVLVRKAFGQRPPARWDIVVFRKPGDGTVLVKRVAGLSGETIAIREGDLLVDGHVAPKPDALREALREPLLRQRFDGPGPRDGWSRGTDPTGAPGPWTWARPLFADEPTYGRETNLAPRPLAHDVYVEVEAGPRASVALRYVREDGAPANATGGWVWERADGVERLVEERGAARAVTQSGTPIGDGTSRVTLSVVDGRVRIESATWSYETEASVPLGRASVSVDGDVRAVAIDRDVHYTNQGAYAVDAATPYRVPEGHVFCLGDHSAHSGDSRLREVGPVPLDHLLGPVIFRVWPPGRIGWPR